jgi:hypothetical protein
LWSEGSRGQQIFEWEWKAQKTKEPINQAASHEAAEAVAAKQLEDGGVTGIKNGGAATLENGGAVAELFGPGHVLLTGDRTGRRAAANRAGHADVATQ